MHSPKRVTPYAHPDYAGAREAEKEELKHLIIYSLFKERQPKCVFLLEWHEKNKITSLSETTTRQLIKN